MQRVVHPQLINTFMTLAARVRAVQDVTQPVSDLTQPQRLGLGNTCLAMMDWPHACISRLVCRSCNLLRAPPRLFSSAEDTCTRKCETIERISAGALG